MRLEVVSAKEGPTLMKMWLRRGMELAAVIVFVPQLFVLSYYFPLLFSGGNRLGLLKSLASHALTISWVSAPLLVLVMFAVRGFMDRRVRRGVTFLFCLAAGYMWVALWNLLVFKTFSYGRATFPVLLCSLCTAGYALARSLYLEGLPPLPAAKNEEPDLSE